MIELGMVRRMIRRGLLATPVVIAGAWLLWQVEGAVSVGAGIGLTLGNLWLAARIIGGVAERSPQLLLPAGMSAFVLGLLLLTGASLLLMRVDAVSFPIMGFTLIGSHLGLVLWEAAGAYGHVEPVPGIAPVGRSSTRS